VILWVPFYPFFSLFVLPKPGLVVKKNLGGRKVWKNFFFFLFPVFFFCFQETGGNRGVLVFFPLGPHETKFFLRNFGKKKTPTPHTKKPPPQSGAFFCFNNVFPLFLIFCFGGAKRTWGAPNKNPPTQTPGGGLARFFLMVFVGFFLKPFSLLSKKVFQGFIWVGGGGFGLGGGGGVFVFFFSWVC